MPADPLTTLYLGTRIRGPGPEVAIEYVRDLTAADYVLLANPQRALPAASPLQRLRHTHHMAARLLAEGRPDGEVALVTGYTGSTIARLKMDPAFRELMSYYQANVEAQYMGVHQKLANVALDFVDELHHRLKEEPDAFTNRELKDTAEMFLDKAVPNVNAPRNGASGGADRSITISFVKSPVPAPEPGAIDGVAVEVKP